MLFAVIFEDVPSKLSVRMHFMPAHIEWLRVNAETIKVAGSLRSTPSAAPEGALWIVEADDVAHVEKLVKADPFTLNGLRGRWTIRHWSKAFPERVTPV